MAIITLKNLSKLKDKAREGKKEILSKHTDMELYSLDEVRLFLYEKCIEDSKKEPFKLKRK